MASMMQEPIADLEPVSEAPRRHRPFLWVVSGVAVVALIAGALALAGNNTGNDTKTATVVLSEAAARTTAKGTARVSVAGNLTMGGETTKIIDGQGETDYANKTTRLTISIGPIIEEIRSVNDVAYMHVSNVTLPNGAYWVTLTAADVSIDPTAGSAFSSSDPSSGLAFLSAVSGSPRAVGKEQVDGVEVTHYEFTLDLKSFFDGMGKASKELNASSVAEGLKALDSIIDLRAIPGEAWIDADGRVHKFAIKIEASDGGQSMKVVDEFTFSHFDEPVDIPTPSASDTVPFKDVPNFFSLIGASAAAGATS